MKVAVPEAARAKKKFTRAAPDYSQRIRRTFQLLFLALNVWIGIEFYLFVRHYETGGASIFVRRPPGVEGWLPIASLMNLRLLLQTGELPCIHPAGLFLLIAFVSMSWLLRKSFCSWLCPVSTVSECLWRIGRQTLQRNFQLPKGLDIGLRSLKYVLLGLFLYAIGSMSAPASRAFLEGPYGLLADVKMLNFFRYLSVTAAVALGILILSSMLVKNAWCRYLCPYGALLGFFSFFGPAKIRREPQLCIDCTRCAKACPAMLPVDRLVTIHSVECTGCLECVAACPAQGALQMSALRKRAVPAWAFASAIAVVFLGTCGYAMLTGHWHTNLPSQVYYELIPRARELAHP